MFTYHPLGDSAFIVRVGNEISPEINSRIYQLSNLITSKQIKGIKELIPAYCELTVVYNPVELSYDNLIDELHMLCEDIKDLSQESKNGIVIPVCYDEEFSPDIDEVAGMNSITRDEVIEIHSSVDYLVYMLGFTPGFCYLGGLDDRIATPRKKMPREIIAAGSVGIAANQTGIYPIDSPGGWQLIGKTPLKLFDPDRSPEFLIEAGDYLRFEPIAVSEYKNIEIQVSKGIYQMKRFKKNTNNE